MKNYALRNCFLFLLLTLPFLQDLYAQEKTGRNLEAILYNLIQTKDNHDRTVQGAYTKEGIKKHPSIDEIMEVIIEFKEEPLIVQQFKTTTRLSRLFFSNRHRQFVDDVTRIQNQLQQHNKKLLKTVQTVRTRRMFEKTFFGVSMDAPLSVIQQVSRLPYVKKIHFIKKVEAVLEQSVSLIKADSVWYQYGSQGEGVIVGIIDTGIDYMHPDLGAGIGPTFKVIGGYDFVNNDNNPMDDNRHGTHVAGIVAANGVLKGVAPKAKLMAYKVLNAGGNGSEDDIIAAIERTVDPNDDGDFSDHLDVVNMSLGGSGGPDDAMSTAVDNAVNAGVIFCIAAGNSYNYRTIGSPGTAREAITVGATDKSDDIASFSSKGPNEDIASIKPEIVAPGAAINSTVLSGQYQSLNGTSMATPHIAGVCALLKVLHPTWTPRQMKSALMTTALDIGKDVMAQGAGRVQPLKAVETDVFAEPAHLSFGRDPNDNLWTVSDTILIRNSSGSSQTFNATFSGVQTGIQLTATPAGFTLNAGETREIIVSLQVNNMILPYPTNASSCYEGKMIVASSSDTLKLPWAFFKSTVATLVFDEFSWDFALTNQNDFVTWYEANDVKQWEEYEIDVEPGNYDLVASFIFQRGIIIKENVSVSPGAVIHVSKNDLTNTIQVNGVNENGSAMDTPILDYIITFPENSILTNWVVEAQNNPSSITQFSDRIKVTPTVLDGDANTNVFRLIHFPTISNGLTSNITVSNLSSDLFTNYLSNINFSYSNTDLTVFSPFALAARRDDSNHYYAWLFFGGWEYDATKTVKLVSSKYAPKYQWGNRAYTLNQDNTVIYNTSDWESRNDTLTTLDDVTAPNAMYYPAGDTIQPGKNPTYIWTVPHNGDPGSPNSYGNNTYMSFYTYGGIDEYKHYEQIKSQFTIYDSSGAYLAQNVEGSNIAMNLALDRYTVEFKDTLFTEKNIAGRAKLKHEFDLRLYDADPPQLTSMRLYKDDYHVHMQKPVKGEPLRLKFSLADHLIKEHTYYRVDTTTVEFLTRYYGSQAWQSLPLKALFEDTYYGMHYEADFTSLNNQDSVGFDVMIRAKDVSGNSIEYSLSPAFSVGSYIRPRNEPLQPTTVGVWADTITTWHDADIILPIRARNFEDIISAQFTLDWNPAIVSFDGIEQSGLDGMDSSSFGFTNTESGQLAFAWLSPDLLPRSLTDDAIIFNVKFHVIGTTNQSTDVRIIQNPTAIEFIDHNLNELAYAVQFGYINLVEYQPVTLSGLIRNGSGTPLPNAMVTIASNGIVSNDMSNQAGQYLANAHSYGNYQIFVNRYGESNIRKGLTTLDVLLMRRHVLGIKLLESPYRIIAADINQSGQISNLDVTLLRSMILGDINTYPSGNAWTFIPSNFVFDDLTQPFSYDTLLTINNPSNRNDLNFTAIKFGDINESWKPDTALTKENKVLTSDLHFEIRPSIQGQDRSIEYAICTKNFNNIAAYQFTFQYDPAELSFSASYDRIGNYIGMSLVSEGKINIGWDDPTASGTTLPVGDTLLVLKFTTQQNLPVVSINSSALPAVAYNGDLQELSILGTMVQPLPQAYALGQNYPNPFNPNTTIKYEVSVKSKITLKIFNIMGQEVKTLASGVKEIGRYDAVWDGRNSKGLQVASGIYIYRLSTPEGSFSKKMIFLK
ncbi:S8 family serine peptidase [bacterium]|nr:S8 family serine peptidase [bacterium]